MGIVDDIQFHTRPITLRESILVQKVQQGDLAAALEAMQLRLQPGLPSSWLETVEMSDFTMLAAKYTEAVTEAMRLSAAAEALTKHLNDPAPPQNRTARRRWR